MMSKKEVTIYYWSFMANRFFFFSSRFKKHPSIFLDFNMTKFSTYARPNRPSNYDLEGDFFNNQPINYCLLKQIDSLLEWSLKLLFNNITHCQFGVS